MIEEKNTSDKEQTVSPKSGTKKIPLPIRILILFSCAFGILLGVICLSEEQLLLGLILVGASLVAALIIIGSFFKSLRPRSKKIALAVVITGIVIIGGVTVLNESQSTGSGYGSGSTTNTPTSKSGVSDSMIIACAKNEIGNILKSFSTAHWGTAQILDEDDFGRYLVYVPLEAQNSFGAYGKLYYMVIVSDVQEDGHYMASTYYSRLEIANYMNTDVPTIVTDYQNGEVAQLVEDFLENNNWNMENK